MKDFGKRRRIRAARLVLVCIALALAAGLFIAGYGQYQQSKTATAHQAYEKIAQAYTARMAEIEAKKKEPVYITLPGADRIQAPVENYEDPTNIWRWLIRSGLCR